MFAQSRPISARLEQEFGRPVESVMKCEDFKSNFARKFSDRFMSRTPALAPRETLEISDNNQEFNEENIVGHVSKLLSQQNNTMEQQGSITLKAFEKSFILNEIRKTEENALNMEVETLRWQLAQTEANRQMHIELLKQIVFFLNKVKDHVGKSNELKQRQNNAPRSNMNRSFNGTHLPRSRSVLVVNNNKEYPNAAIKRSNSRRISKSINNVNGDQDRALSTSKLSLICETDDSSKLKEEMTRLINLAHSVLSTKLPDLACTCNSNRIENNKVNNTIQLPSLIEESKSLTIKNNLKEDPEFTNTLNNKNTEVKENNLSNYFTSSLNLPRDAHDTFNDMKYNDKKLKNVSNSIDKLHQTNKKNDFISSTFIEDESGFSSMNSFQEIGIPIINIIPATPNKELPYIDDTGDELVEEPKEWKSPLDEQSVKVFWV